MGERLLLLGHTGKLGSALLSALTPHFEVTGRSSMDLDATDGEKLRTLLDDLKPSAVVNAVGFLGIDPCEADPARAFAVNRDLPGALAGWCEANGATLTHFSTDAVFGEEKDTPYTEEDAPAPIHVYGESKLAGEEAVRAGCGSSYVFRVPLLFGPGGKGLQFFERMLARAAQGSPLKVADDVVSSPTYNLDVADRVAEMLVHGAPFSTYHLSGLGHASLFELVSEAVALWGFEVYVERASWRDFPGVGRKNLYTPLASLRTQPLRPWRKSLAAFREVAAG